MSFQISLKSPDYSVDHFDKLIERRKQRLSPSNLRLADRFMNSQLEVLFPIRTEPARLGLSVLT